MSVEPGERAKPGMLVDVDRLIAAYYEQHPDPSEAEQQVSFGTSGHRGSSLDGSFNEDHILATTEAICRYRAMRGIDGPLFIGRDTHALSEPATRNAIEVTPSHNPPEDGGFKYNPPNGGPADKDVTGWIQDEANRLLAAGLEGVSRTEYDQAITDVQRYDFLGAYVGDLPAVVDLDAVRQAG